MIYGVGTDLAQIKRIEKSLQSPAFMQRVYGSAEREMLEKCSSLHRSESAAANFAAKEAFLKACGKGIGDFALSEIQILRRESGAPCYQFSGKTQAFVEKENLTAQISLSHEGGFALAFAVLEING